MPPQVLMTFRLTEKQLRGLRAALTDDETGKFPDYVDAATLILAKDGELYLSLSDDDFADMEKSHKEHGPSHGCAGIRL